MQIDTIWEIQYRPENGEFPFVIVATRGNGQQIGFGCHTLAEAEAKLRAIAIVEAENQKNTLTVH